VRAFAARALTPDYQRLRVRGEDKDAIAAFHWRGAPDEDAAKTTVDAIAQRAQAAGLRTHWGRKVLEVRPPVKIDKGSGILRLLKEVGPEIEMALYVGDDTTDIDAFRALGSLVEEGRLERAVRVGVQSEEGPSEIRDEADLLVDGPEGVRELLTLLSGE
jgi:trehalose 6-phosphate phosphatase